MSPSLRDESATVRVPWPCGGSGDAEGPDRRGAPRTARRTRGRKEVEDVSSNTRACGTF